MCREEKGAFPALRSGAATAAIKEYLHASKTVASQTTGDNAACYCSQAWMGDLAPPMPLDTYTGAYLNDGFARCAVDPAGEVVGVTIAALDSEGYGVVERFDRRADPRLVLEAGADE